MMAAAGAASAQVGSAGGKLKICIFSKHFQWTDWRETAEIAAKVGFDGVDLTVRKGGHILPENVERDLPLAVETVKKAGLAAPMVTAGIVDAKSPHAEKILSTLKGLGIPRYRWGGFDYDYSRSIAGQLDELKPRVRALAELNRKYGVAAMYHTHSGLKQVGAPIWDLWELMKDIEPGAVGVNYDIGHATVEGGFGGWVNSAYLLEKMMLGVALKDFVWGKGAKGGWAPQWCAAGAGMVDFAGFFAILKKARFAGPVQLHFEYPELGQAHEGKPVLDIPKDKFVAILKRDLDYVRGLMGQAALV